MACHDLKILPQFYEAVISGRKKFELRKNDRDFKVGDTIKLREWSNGRYSGRETTYRIGYMLQDYEGLDGNYVILGIEPSINIRE